MYKVIVNTKNKKFFVTRNKNIVDAACYADALEFVKTDFAKRQHLACFCEQGTIIMTTSLTQRKQIIARYEQDGYVNAGIKHK